LTPEQFEGWKLYAQIDPFGEARADMRMARQCFWTHNRPQKRLDEAAYMLEFAAAKIPETPEHYKERAAFAYMKQNAAIEPSDPR